MLRPSLAFSDIGSVLHGTPAAGVSQTLRLSTGNGITELSQRAPPIFGWEAITLGIGLHSSLISAGYTRNTKDKDAITCMRYRYNSSQNDASINSGRSLNCRRRTARISTARRHASAIYAVVVCLYVCLSQVGVY